MACQSVYAAFGVVEFERSEFRFIPGYGNAVFQELSVRDNTEKGALI
jgi:hypothetical protein